MGYFLNSPIEEKLKVDRLRTQCLMRVQITLKGWMTETKVYCLWFGFSTVETE